MTNREILISIFYFFYPKKIETINLILYFILLLNKKQNSIKKKNI